MSAPSIQEPPRAPVSQPPGPSPKSTTNSKPRKTGSRAHSPPRKSSLASTSAPSRTHFPASTNNSGFDAKGPPFSFPNRDVCCWSGRKNTRNAIAGACAVRSKSQIHWGVHTDANQLRSRTAPTPSLRVHWSCSGNRCSLHRSGPRRRVSVLEPERSKATPARRASGIPDSPPASLHLSV
jgi:hypothetical protein